MRIRLLLAAAATSMLAACGESTTSPRLTPTDASRDVITTPCRSGYHIATREDGTEYCAPAQSEARSAPATTTIAP